jgi:hypothetical protein
MPCAHDPSRPNRTPPWRTEGAAQEHLRVSDSERSEVSNLLCRHFGDGRLDDAELEERLATVAAAKTRAELYPVLADLPPPDTGGSAPPPAHRRSSAMPLLAAVLVVGAVWWTAGLAFAHFSPPIPWIPIAVVAFFVLRRRRRHGVVHPVR